MVQIVYLLVDTHDTVIQIATSTTELNYEPGTTLKTIKVGQQLVFPVTMPSTIDDIKDLKDQLKDPVCVCYTYKGVPYIMSEYMSGVYDIVGDISSYDHQIANIKEFMTTFTVLLSIQEVGDKLYCTLTAVSYIGPWKDTLLFKTHKNAVCVLSKLPIN